MSTYWIQNGDISVSVDDDPVQSVAQVIDALDSYDWISQNQIQQELEKQGKDNCPPGLGVVREAGIILHICPDGEGCTENQSEEFFSDYLDH